MRRILLNFLWTFQNLMAGLHLVLFAPVSRRAFHFSTNQVLILLFLATGAMVLSVYPFTGNAVAFAPNLWTILASRAFLALLLYYFISRFQRAPHTFPALAVAMFSISIFFSLLQVPVGQLHQLVDTSLPAETPRSNHTLVGILFVVIMALWVYIAATRSIRLIYTASWLRAGLIGATITLSGIAMNWTLSLYAWSAPPQAQALASQATAERDPGPYVSTEQTYYAQPRMLGDQIAALAPARPGLGELYFIGFAGTSTADVFMKEVRVAQDLFNDRFDTRNRSLILVNNPYTVKTLPVASATNLDWAIAAMAEKMNVADDILFLYMTSHGSPHRFSVSFPQLALGSLTDRQLRNMLDRAGIKWRVIVISACYSGSFIDALKDDHSMILTAAAADRTSFGCGNEDEFTYFGDAYINQALRQDRSFISAFNRARDIIAAREAAEEKTPSRPQIYIGAAMKTKLDALEQRLAKAPMTTATQ